MPTPNNFTCDSCGACAKIIIKDDTLEVEFCPSCGDAYGNQDDFDNIFEEEDADEE
jgi:hypothetical protein